MNQRSPQFQITSCSVGLLANKLLEFPDGIVMPVFFDINESSMQRVRGLEALAPGYGSNGGPLGDSVELSRPMTVSSRPNSLSSDVVK